MTNKRQGQATALKDEMARQSASSCLLLLLSATLVATVGAFLHLPSLLFAASGSTNELDVARRIERIENGLLPAITIKGQPLRKMNIADRMKYYNVPGVSIAFFDHGRITWTKTYGYANVAEQRPITAETLFQAGSISKPTTGLAVLRLVEEGRLDLDEDVNAKLSEWKVPENEFTKEQKVTLRRLLSHTAGVNIHGFIGYPQGNPVPSLLQVLKGEKPANTPPVQVVMTPGTTWRYSGGGYTIVQLLLTELEHRPFPQIMEDLVLRPAGMTHSTFQQPLPQSFWPLAATPYRGDGSPEKGGFYVYPEMAAAGLWTTPSDLARMAIEVQEEYVGTSNKILFPKMARVMLSRQKDRWGLGFAVEEPGHDLRFGHGGSDEGFESRLETYTKSGEGIAIMTNGARGDELLGELMCSVAQEYGWPDFHPQEHALVRVPPTTMRAYAGRYRLPDGSRLVVMLKDNRAYLEGIAPDPQEILPESSTQFFILSDQTTFRFSKGDPAPSITIYDGGEVLVANRIPEQ
jgi:CubicO group peptidase (beta-lactamase class C family)